MTLPWPRGVAALALLLLALLAIHVGAQQPGPRFPPASVDYFAGMDGGIRLEPPEIRGRNTWLMWTAGNEAFWDYLAAHSFGTFDLLKVLDSRDRARRFATYGLMNEPGLRAAGVPDQHGLWLDVPDDGAAAENYRESFPRDDFIAAYGRSSGIVGLRLFANPRFDATARRAWDPRRYYEDPAYFRDPGLVRPYRVGMACGFCHVGPNPIAPPADPEHPQWENLASYVGAQYWHAAPIFSFEARPDSFLYQVLNSMPPGTVDTSALASDNINNPRNMNAIYALGTRLKLAQEEDLAGGNLDLPGTKPRLAVPHVLKDGADSVGVAGALSRVYLSIGAVHDEWLKHFNLLVGGKRQTPVEAAVLARNAPYWRATTERLPDLAAFFLAVTRPHPLKDAPGGQAYLGDDPATVGRGAQVFAETCAACHSGKFPPPPDGVTQFSPEWDTWTRSEDFAREMTKLVRAPDFLDDNYLSTDRRYPITRIGTNACAPLATNALRGHVWDSFSSETYKNLPAVGTIEVEDPLTGAPGPYPMPGGGRGYQRAPSLISIWASAPYLHNNAVGKYIHDPSVAARMEAFQDGIEKLLWAKKRPGRDSIYRTTAESWLVIDRDYLPPGAFALLQARGVIGAGERELRVGPIPEGTPVNLLANLDLELSLARLDDWVRLLANTGAALRDIKQQGLSGDAARERLQALVPDLLRLSKCPDFVTDRGHLFGTNLPDDDKRALIAFLKRL